MLDCVEYMRAQSLIGVFPYDLVLLTMVHEAAACFLGIGLGSYTHFAISLHYYEADFVEAARLRACTETPEPSMGETSNPGPLISERLIAAEVCLSDGGELAEEAVEDAYWGGILQTMQSSLKGGQ